MLLCLHHWSKSVEEPSACFKSHMGVSGTCVAGGPFALVLGRGRDCTALFECYHPFTRKPAAILPKYKAIKDLQPGSAPKGLS